MNSPLVEDLFSLAKRARDLSPGPQVGYRSDGSTLLALGSAEAVCSIDLDGLPLEPRVIHYHPAKGWSVEQAIADMQALKKAYPGCHIHGMSPAWLASRKDRMREMPELDSFCLFTGSVSGQPELAGLGWRQCMPVDVVCQASFIYGPDATLRDIRTRLDELKSCKRLESILPLPLAVGDRVVVPGATTAGVLDMEVLATCACELPGVQVRASWAALGWKIAQASVAFGATQITGWGLEELLAYTSRTRPASIVGTAEVLQGMAEAHKIAEVCH